MSKLAQVITSLSLMQIDENALLHDVVKLLKGRETFIDETNNNEVIYQGDVFGDILGAIQEAIDMKLTAEIPNAKTISQLEELAKIVAGDYIMVINRK